MLTNMTTKGRTVSLRRLLTGFGATFVLGLALTAGTASATTVYDYVYSGDYIDGSAAGGAFSTKIGGLDYDRKTKSSTSPKTTSPGALSPGSISMAPASTSRPRRLRGIEIDKGPLQQSQPGRSTGRHSIRRAARHAGNIYADGNGYVNGWDATGAPLPGFPVEASETGTASR